MKKTQHQILQWNTTRLEAITITEIVQRFRKVAPSLGIQGVDPITLDMDLTACHLNGCPLDLVGLLNASNGDFNHDITGIVGNIDRATGKLGDHFTPRHSLGDIQIDKIAA